MEGSHFQALMPHRAASQQSQVQGRGTSWACYSSSVAPSWLWQSAPWTAATDMRVRQREGEGGKEGGQLVYQQATAQNLQDLGAGPPETGQDLGGVLGTLSSASGTCLLSAGEPLGSLLLLTSWLMAKAPFCHHLAYTPRGTQPLPPA